LFVWEIKSVYVLRGGDAKPDIPLIGGVLLLALCEDEEGGVLGRFELEDRELNHVLA